MSVRCSNARCPHFDKDWVAYLLDLAMDEILAQVDNIEESHSDPDKTPRQWGSPFVED